MNTIENSPHIELAGFGGTLVHPEHPDYDEYRRVYNGMIDRRPAAIARCRRAQDVICAVNFARDHAIAFSVYGGGHSVTGSAVCDGGLVIDLREMKGLTIDPIARTGRFQAGLTWGEFDAATAAHGLALTGGRNPTTGIAGLALGSGSGWLERKFGYVCDNLLEAEVITAEGIKVIASASENADLFWGLRGGGGNFGIVTEFKFRLHPLPNPILGGAWLYPPTMAAEIVKAFRDFMETAPDELGGGVIFATAPDAPPVPEPVRGQPIVLLQLVYAGEPDLGQAVLAPLRATIPPVGDLVRPASYPELQRTGPNFPGVQNYWTADFLDDLPDAAIDAYAPLALSPIAPESAIILVKGGGAPSRVDDDATAFGMRTAPWNIHYICGWRDRADNARNIERVKQIASVLKPWASGGVYLNYIGDEGKERVASAFGREKMRRLRQLKSRWDPQNLFCHNHNILPLQSSETG